MRVITGSARGRKLLCPAGKGTRPTPDRVREALFSILGGEVAGARVLDLFAGTGALGIEALSRGAESAVFVERDRAALDLLKKNLDACGFSPRARVTAAAVATFLRPGLPADATLVFADPPYEGEDGPRALELIARGLLDPGSPGRELLVVYEHSPRSSPPVPPGLTVTDSRRYGDTCLLFLRPSSPPEGG
jgi:16S rRNA (guanine966-N2)-methyltransferase